MTFRGRKTKKDAQEAWKRGSSKKLLRDAGRSTTKKKGSQKENKTR